MATVGVKGLRKIAAVYFLDSLDLAFCCVGSVRGRLADGPAKFWAAVLAFAYRKQPPGYQQEGKMQSLAILAHSYHQPRHVITVDQNNYESSWLTGTWLYDYIK